MNCFFCENIIKKSNKKHSICKMCYEDKMIGYEEFKNTNLDKKYFTKYYFENKMCFIREDIDKFDPDELNDQDIICMKDIGIESTEESRLEFLTAFAKYKDLDINLLRMDKYVNAFVDYGLVKSNINDFLKRLVNIY